MKPIETWIFYLKNVDYTVVEFLNLDIAYEAHQGWW